MGRKKDILQEVEMFVGVMGNAVANATNQLKGMGIQFIGDVRDRLTQGLDPNNHSSTTVRPMNVQTSRFANLISLNLQESTSDDQIKEFPKNSDNLQQIFQSFMNEMRSVFGNNRSTLQYQRYVSVQMSFVKAEMANGFFKADFLKIFK